MLQKNKFKVNVGKRAKISVEWSDVPENYSKEKSKHIQSILSNRYGITKEQVKVVFTPKIYNEKGELVDISKEVINNIQDPKFQIKLFNDYIKENNIENCDFEYIKKIDSEINSKIDYDVYEKYRKYTIKWIEWDNFLSYGEGNRFNFDELSGLTLLSGSSFGNQVGKSSFAIDLISFLLFGKTQKPYNLSECFNKYLDVKTFNVTGCINIEGQDYIIERNVERSKKRSGEWGDGSQKVKYYRIINDEKEDLEEFDKNDTNHAGEHSIKTNKIIKEAIGSEKDFKMIISATGKDLDSLIDEGATERGRLLSKWIGLFPLEEKDKIAKDKYKDFEKNLKSRMYNEADLLVETENLKKAILNDTEIINVLNKALEALDKSISDENKNKDILIQSKRQIDPNILKIDINTVNMRLGNIEKEANIKKEELKLKTNEFEPIKDIQFNNDDYKSKLTLDKTHSIEINNVKNEIARLKALNIQLKDSEFCPTCKRKYENKDNSQTILENEKKIEELIKKGTETKKLLDDNKLTIDKLEVDKVNYDKKLKLMSILEIIPLQIENLRTEYREKQQLIKDFNQNKESIELNNNIDINLTNINAKIRAFNIERDNKLKELENNKRNIVENNKKIEKNDIIIVEIKKEFEEIKNWKIYLDMVGKNGISKMVLRKTLPIINSELDRLLDDVCDFTVEVVLNEKNDVHFKIVKDDVSSSLGGSSGFEKTASALALRCVLGNISTMPKPNFITLDEILGGVAKDNYDNMRNMYAKIEKNYQFILHISHLEEIKDWHNNIVTFKKENNISKIDLQSNNLNNFKQ